MKKQLGVGYIPYEIGDKIILKSEKYNDYEILDIRMIQYIKDQRIEFEVSLEGWKEWISAELIKKQII